MKEPRLFIMYACQCNNQSLEAIQLLEVIIKLLVDEGPWMCLLLNEQGESPLDSTVGRRDDIGRLQVEQITDILDVLKEATKDAVIALLVCVERSMIARAMTASRNKASGSATSFLDRLATRTVGSSAASLRPSVEWRPATSPWGTSRYRLFVPN
jgi:hypothetical protein